MEKTGTEERARREGLASGVEGFNERARRALADPELHDSIALFTRKTLKGRAARLADGLKSVPGASFEVEPQANMIFARLPRATHQRLHEEGAVYGLYDGPLDEGEADEPLLARLVCDWSITEEEIDRFVEVAKG